MALSQSLLVDRLVVRKQARYVGVKLKKFLESARRQFRCILDTIYNYAVVNFLTQVIFICPLFQLL